MVARARRKVEPETDLDLSGLLATEAESTNGGGATTETYAETDVIESAPLSDGPEETKPNIHPKEIGPRHSTEALFSMAYGGLGTYLTMSGTDIPVGRVLQFQAPIAGNRIDQIIAGTWIDKLLQPIVRYQETAEGVGSLILLPLLIAAFERKPDLAGFPMFEKIIRGAVESSLMEMAPLLKKQASDTRKAARTVADIQGMGVELGLGPEEMKDPIGALIAGFFYVPEQPEEGRENV